MQFLPVVEMLDFCRGIPTHMNQVLCLRRFFDAHGTVLLPLSKGKGTEYE
jgi:hypothetical protein